MIDVIIPAYNAHNTIEQTLYSLSFQVISDIFNVYIVNDASLKNYNEFIDFFSGYFNSMTELVLTKNSGSGIARQLGIDNSSSEFIIFIDADDVFMTPYSVLRLYEEIKDYNYDVVMSKMFEEIDSGFVKYDFDEKWLHGKIYRRSSLNKYNISFNSNRTTQDISFNKSIFLQNVNVSYLDLVTYIWKNNKNSVTRKNRENFIAESLCNFESSYLYGITNALAGDANIDKISCELYACIIYFYFCYLLFSENNCLNEGFKTVYNLIKLSDNYPINDKKKDKISLDVLHSLIDKYGGDISIFKIINPKIMLTDFLNCIVREVEGND